MSNEYLAEICDKLLGVNRNDPLKQQVTKGVKFYDAEVCKDFLVFFCPHLLFANTKSDLGPCPKKFHDEALKEQFLAHGEKYRAEYESKFFEYISYIIAELQRKIRKAQSRLEAKATDEVEQLLNPEKDEFEEKRAIIDVQMKNLIQKMEEFGAQGKIREVQEINNQLEMLKAEMERLRLAEESNPLTKQDKKMEVCQVCGSFLIMNDASKRLEAHFEGKQHAGYQRIWETYEALKAKYARSRDNTASERSSSSSHSHHGTSRRLSRERSPSRHAAAHRDDRRDREHLGGSPPRRGSGSKLLSDVDARRNRERDGDRHNSGPAFGPSFHESSAKYQRRDSSDRHSSSNDRHRSNEREHRRDSRH